MDEIGIFNLDGLEPLIDEIRDLYISNGRGMSYGWKSNKNCTYDYGHWNNVLLKSSRIVGYDHNELPYINAHPKIQELWKQIQKVIGHRVLVRAYVNGYTYGTDAYYHKDDIWIKNKYPDSVSETILIYMNEEEWNRDWGGETTFLDDDNNFKGAAFPKRNRGVIFNSDIWHSARNLTRACPVFRSVLVFKTAGSQYNQPFVKWIKDRTNEIQYSDITLFEHLHRTALIAESGKQVESEIVKAALYHSIYDTEFFDGKLGINREEVVEQIGEEAEDLVYTFCNLKSRFTRIYNNSEEWFEKKHYQMLILELANTLEQETRRPTENGAKAIRLLNEKLDIYTL